MEIHSSLIPLQKTLASLREEGKLLIAILYGSYAEGKPHSRSDLDLAIFLKAENPDEEMEITDRILLSSDQEIAILRLDDEDESPLVVQEALHGIHLVEPDQETLYGLSRRILHECESIRFRRKTTIGKD